jgi:hypothetical protein
MLSGGSATGGTEGSGFGAGCRLAQSRFGLVPNVISAVNEDHAWHNDLRASSLRILDADVGNPDAPMTRLVERRGDTRMTAWAKIIGPVADRRLSIAVKSGPRRRSTSVSHARIDVFAGQSLVQVGFKSHLHRQRFWP